MSPLSAFLHLLLHLTNKMTNITKGTVIIDSQETLRQVGIEPEAFNYLMKKLKLKVEYVETPDCPRDVDDILKSYDKLIKKL